MSFLFYLGQNQSLSLAEIKAVFPLVEIEILSTQLAKIVFPSNLNPLDKANRLGGTVKIASLVGSMSEDLEDQLYEIIKTDKNKNFSFSEIGRPDFPLAKIGLGIKDKLHEEGINRRFVSAHQTLSPVIIKKQHATELVLDFIHQEIYQTTWVHDFNAWITRDRKKPYIDPKGGMLPPKLARIMVNLALGDKDPSNLTLLDPFCGTGTVLMEASLLGLKVIGTDISKEKVDGARKNLAWLPENHYFAPQRESGVQISDAVKVSSKITDPVDLVVTEPFLGPPKFTPGRVPNIVKGLQKLYLGALKDWSRFLPTGARIVFVFPQFIVGNRTISTSDFIDSRENLSYNLLVKDLVFTRPGAQIIRQIVILEKK